MCAVPLTDSEPDCRQIRFVFGCLRVGNKGFVRCFVHCLAFVVVSFGSISLNADGSSSSCQNESIQESYRSNGLKEASVRAQSKQDEVGFRRFLRNWEQDELVPVWALGLWKSSDDYQTQLEQAWVVAGFVEKGLRTESVNEFKRRHSEIFSGTHVNTDSFQLINVLTLRRKFIDLQKKWVETRFLGIENKPTAQSVQYWKSLIDQMRSLDSPLQTIFQFSNQTGDLDLRSKIANLKAELDTMKAWSLMVRWELSKPEIRNSEDLLSSKELFLKTIGLTDQDLNERLLNAEFDEIDPKSRIHLLGLSLVLSYLKQWEPANACFQTQFDKLPGSQRIQARAIHVALLLESRRWEDVFIVTNKTLEKLARQRQLVGNFSILLAKNVQVFKGNKQEKRKCEDFLQQVYRLLIRRNQFDVVRRMVKITEVDPTLELITGQLFQMETLFQNDRFQKLSSEERNGIAKKLKAFLNSQHPDLTDRLRYWSYARLGFVFSRNEDQKAISFLDSARRLAASSSPDGQLIFWEFIRRSHRFFQSMPSGEEKDSYRLGLLSEIDKFQEAFPKGSNFGLAKVIKASVNYAEDPVRLHQVLRGWNANRSGYQFAKQMLLADLHRRWLEYFAENKRKRDLAKEIVDLCTLIDGLTIVIHSDARKKEQLQNLQFQVRLIAVDVLQNMAIIDESSKQWVGDLSWNQKDVRDKSRQVIYATGLCRVWHRLGKYSKIIKAGDEILSITTNPKEKKNVLIVLTEAYEAQLKTLWDIEKGATFQLQRKAVTERAIARYDQLGQLLFLEKDDAGNVNQMVYLSVKSAFWLAKIGKHNQAVEKLKWANETLPGKTFIEFPLARQLGQSKEFQASVTEWRKVIPSLRVGSERWFEAKVGLIRALKEVNRDEADKEMESIGKLFPNLKQPWAGQIEKLQK